MENESRQPSGSHSEKQWFALRTRARHEKAVRQRLSHLGFEQLLPTLTRLSQWKDRKKLVEEPLFPGYCFARFLGLAKITVLEIPGVAYIVSRGDCPEPVPQDEIDALIRLTTSGLPYEPCASLDEGTLVEIIRGPLSGVKGRFIRRKSHHYVTIGVQLLGQGATVRINVDDVVAVKSPVKTSGLQRSLQLNRV
jgi:transcription termination/antitermination protein NusG